VEYFHWLPSRLEELDNETPKEGHGYESIDDEEDDDKDKEDTSDPFRSVLFDDIKSILFPLHHPKSRKQLIVCFLNLLGVQMHPGMTSSHLSLNDAFAHSELSSDLCAARFVPHKKENNGPNGLEEPRFSFPLKSFPLSTHSLFQSKNRVCFFDEVDGKRLDELGFRSRQIVR
jgi:hypothetical protein